MTSVPAFQPRKLLKAGQVAVTLGLLAFLLSWIDLAETAQLATSVAPGYVLLMLLCSSGERLFGAWRWHLLLRERHPSLRFSAVARLTFVSLFAGLFLPGAAGTYAVRAYGLARLTSDFGLSIASLVADRLLVGLALLTLGAAGVFAVHDMLPAGLAESLLGAIAFLALAILAVAHPRSGRILHRLLAPRCLEPARRLLEQIYGFMHEALAEPRMLALHFATALVFQLFRVALLVLALRALNVEASVAVALFVMPATVLAMIAPISFGGLGVREAAFVLLLGLFAVTPEAAFASALLIYVVAITTTLPGALFLSRGVLGRPARDVPG